MSGALRALLPGGGVLLAAAVFLVLADAPLVEYVASTYGLVTYGAGLALAWVFHRSRAFITLGLFAWLDIAIVGSAVDRSDLLLSLGTVVIVLVGVLGVLRDRGVLSSIGAMQAVAVSAVAALGGFFFSDDARVARFADNPAILPLEIVVWPGYPAITLVAVVLAVAGVGWGFYRYRGAVERAFVWSLVALMVAMHPEIGSAGSALFLMASGLTMTLGVVETSYVMAYQDELTGLPGRRALMQWLDGVKGAYSIAMVDVDHFKRFNDRHGHDVGDQVLKLVASRLAQTSGGARAYRYGGEEFTLVFPGTERSATMTHLEATRRAVAETRFQLRSWKRPSTKPEQETPVSGAKLLSVTVSLGVADTEGNDPYEIVLKRADQALYRAKKNGRNRIET